MIISNIKNIIPSKAHLIGTLTKMNTSLTSFKETIDSIAEAIVGLPLNIDDDYDVNNQPSLAKPVENLIGEQCQ